MTDLTQPISTRAVILAKAREMFLSQGFHQTTMRAIAQAAGISTGPLYFHFKNKAEVFFHICSEAYDVLLSDFRKAADEQGHAGYKLRNMYYAYKAFYYQEPQLFEIIQMVTNPLSGINLPATLQESLYEKWAELLLVMEGVIREGIARGELRDVDPRKLSFYLHSVAEGVFHYYRSGILARNGINLDEMIDVAINLVGLGMINLSFESDSMPRCE